MGCDVWITFDIIHFNLNLGGNTKLWRGLTSTGQNKTKKKKTKQLKPFLITTKQFFATKIMHLLISR